LDQHIEVNVGFLLTIYKEGAGNSCSVQCH